MGLGGLVENENPPDGWTEAVLLFAPPAKLKEEAGLDTGDVPRGVPPRWWWYAPPEDDGTARSV